MQVLTRDEIHALSDPELRKTIAEELGYILMHGYMDEASINPKDYWVTPPKGRLTSVLPNWPADIADAWELVEDMLDNNMSFSLLNLISVPDRYLMDIRQRGSARILLYTTAPTAPRAICEAWLIWSQEKKHES